MKSLVCGEGIYKKEGWRVDAIHSVKYRIWVDMLTRCYDKKVHARMPTYEDCYVSENFKDFQFFAEWCNSQIGFNLPKYHLDKDILVKGNKVYSEDTCCFVPEEINYAVSKRRASRGDFPIGVSFYKRIGRYRAYLSINGKQEHLGYFDTTTEAFNAYRIAKESYIKSLAERFKACISPSVYDRLLQWTTEIED